MSELAQRIANLSPEKRALLERRLVAKTPAATNGQQTIRRDPSAPVVLSFGQQRLWFLEQLEPQSPLHLIPTALHIQGALDIAALQRTFNTVVSRHEVLRMTFATVAGKPVPVVAAERTIDLPLIDLSIRSPEERDEEVDRLMEQERQQGFDLAHDLPLRIRLIRLAPDEHILLQTWHHIASDAWSAGVWAREFSTLYEAYTHGNPSPLPDLPIQYADFARWQHNKLQGETLEAQLTYWKRQLANSPPVLDLPTDRPRPRVQSFHGAEESLLLPKQLIEQVEQIGRQEGATLFMTLLAAFKVLLHRYSGQHDMLVGTPVAGRQAPETEPLIGLFLNTLVLRTDLGGEPTFRDLLRRVRSVAVDAYAHQDVPFERLVEELHVERDLSRTPLFQVMFNLRNVRRPRLHLAGLTLTPLPNKGKVAKHDLTLATTELADGLRLELEYSTDLFDQGTIIRMLGHFQVLLEAVVANPDQQITRLPLLTDAERHQIVHAWNDTAAPFPHDQSLIQMFEAQVAAQPDATTFMYEGTRLSYRQLNRRANQLAHHLRTLAVGPGIVVGVCLPRSLESVISFLGILKAGGVYLPLDPSYPQARLQFMLEDSRAAVIVTQQQWANKLAPGTDVQIICLDTMEQTLDHLAEQDLGHVAHIDDLAYIIYTSGSTGQPKGVAVEHRPILNRLAWMWQAHPFAIGEVGCHKTALGFVDAIWEVLGPLLQGVPSVILPDHTVRDPHLLVHALAEHSVTRLWLVPSLLRVLLDTFPDLQRRLPVLRMWVTTGEVIDAALYRRCRRAMPQNALYNQYGASEASNTSWYAPPRDDQDLVRVPIGRPITNTKIYILDRHLQPVPIGVPGELCVGGLGLARGYVNRPDLSAEKFIDVYVDALSPIQNRLYKTGDLARYLPDGTIEYLGRCDTQVKVRGFRIETGEIEATLAQHPQIRQAVVVTHRDDHDEQRLIAYVVAHDTTVSEHELRDWLKARLPEYMIPSAFMLLDELPLTPSGKVDRQALPQPTCDHVERDHEFAAPQDALELQLTLLWERVLQRSGIGVRDNFFDLGGHSLLAVRLFAQIEAQLGRRLPLAALFQAPTIEGLSKLLHEDGWSPPWRSLVAIQPSGTKRPFFWVPAAGMTALSFVDLARHLGPDQPFYAFQPFGLDQDHEPHHSVEAMATAYLQELRLLQPEGPYLLGGRCFGSSVAFEIAQRLIADGEEVALLALQDGDPPDGDLAVPGTAGHYLHRFVRHWQQGRLREALERYRRRKVRDGRLAIKRHVTYMIGNREARRIQRVHDAHLIAKTRYVGQTYPGTITLFWSSEWFAYLGELWHARWDRLAGAGVENHVVPGLHWTMLEAPSVEELAAQLRTCLDAVHQDERSST